MGKIAEWIWPEIRDLKSHNSMLEAGIKVMRERIGVLEADLADKSMKLQKFQSVELSTKMIDFFQPKPTNVIRGKTSAEIRRMTEKEGERDV